jgi:hypothetical protein
MLNVLAIKKNQGKTHYEQFAVPLSVIKFATELKDKDNEDQDAFFEDIQDAVELTELVNEISESGWLSNPEGSIDYLLLIERDGYSFCVAENNIFYFGYKTHEQLKQLSNPES